MVEFVISLFALYVPQHQLTVSRRPRLVKQDATNSKLERIRISNYLCGGGSFTGNARPVLAESLGHETSEQAGKKCIINIVVG